jgi:hypothetical protein
MSFRTWAGSLALLAAASTAVLLYADRPARGSDHQDSIAVVDRPGADISDVYMFPSPANANNIDLVMNVHPLIPAGMGGSYQLDPGVLYQFKFSHGPVGTMNPEDTVLQVVASGTGSGQTVSVYGPVTPKLSGTHSILTGQPKGTFAFNQPNGTTLSNGITAFAGPRADPFFFDLFQFFSILPDRYYANPRTGNKLGTSTPTFNGYSAGSTSGPNGSGYACSTAASTNALTQINGGFNVISIVLEVPRTMLVPRGASQVTHMWATTSTPTGTKINGREVYVQGELLSRPAVKELFETFKQHQFTNQTSPYADVTIKNAIYDFSRRVVGRSSQISTVLQEVLYPNELTADLSQSGAASYLGVETGGATGGLFGGRGLTDDVIDISLGAVFGNTIPAITGVPDDGKENGCLTNEHVTSGQGGTQTQSSYPYLAQPH